MMEAFLGRDASFDGIFVTAVHTTGIFCRPSCPARKPLPENVSFFGTPEHALLEGYRPCRRCRPMQDPGTPPSWVRDLLDAVDADPTRRWTDADLRRRGLSPERVRRWFKRSHGMTFHAYSRARRLGSALGSMQNGARVTRAAFGSGFDSLSGFNEAFRRYFGAAPTSTAGKTVAHVDRITTPLGPMLVGVTDEALCLLEFVDRRALENQVKRVAAKLDAAFVPDRTALTERVEEQVSEYFEGGRRSFDLPLAVAGSPFQQEVWDALRAIPYGETRSYGELAAAMGRPAAVRAVGKANGDNALAIVVPCHRVIGADGKLVGYGGKLWRKMRLLELEGGTPPG
ncbi:MAG TPA: trifunctional transcriptional activator/DNA repair protein Ada/methylated-DNA--[protein]-cysteine S-methyltransferase [Longimicrobiales bacterium]|nr:trifunctional transcriptional activator/DNA repair protein Ada/methylated-DNA--[protein]-cysteine S-methyltransferase [Longimicrobiales bacterium]